MMRELTRDQKEIQRLRAALRDLRAQAVEGRKHIRYPFDPYECYAEYQHATGALQKIEKAVTAALTKKNEVAP